MAKLKTYAERHQELLDKAKSIGLNLNYKPGVKVEDIEAITHDEWLHSRRFGYSKPGEPDIYGIGGSDAGGIMGANKYLIPEVLAEAKINGIAPELDEDSLFRTECGHVMELPIWHLYARITGLGVLEENMDAGIGNYGCFVDRGQYYHPLHPFMFGDCDAAAITKEGERIGLEIKTYDASLAYKWKEGVLGQGARIKNPEYEWQVRHYMAVLNLDRFDIVACCDFNPNNVKIITVYRDLDKEKLLIEKEEAFIKALQYYENTGEMPDEFKVSSLNEKTEKKLEEVKVKSLDPGKTSPITLPEECVSYLREYMDLKKKSDIIDERMNLLKSNIKIAMQDNAYGKCEDDDYLYNVSYTETETKRLDAKKIKQHCLENGLEVDDFKSASTSRRLLISDPKEKRFQ